MKTLTLFVNVIILSIISLSASANAGTGGGTEWTFNCEKLAEQEPSDNQLTLVYRWHGNRSVLIADVFTVRKDEAEKPVRFLKSKFFKQDFDLSKMKELELRAGGIHSGKLRLQYGESIIASYESFSAATKFNCTRSSATELPPEAFAVGLDNSDSQIIHLSSLTGLSIQEIEYRAKPCAYTKWPGCSTAGFLGKDEKLTERLFEDNDYVHSKGLTHADLSVPLLVMLTLDPAYCTPDPSGWSGKCVYRNRKYEVTLQCTNGFQESIFDDGLRSSCDLTLKDQARPKTLGYAEMLPYYIALYGFYEGNTDYRLSPESVINFFELAP